MAVAVHVVWWAVPLPNTTAGVVKEHPSPMTPVGCTFWVWIPILFLQGLGAVFQALPRGYISSKWKGPAVAAIGIYWQLGWYAQIAWEIMFAQGTGGWLLGALLAQLLATAFFTVAYIRLHNTFCQPRLHVSMLGRTYAYFVLPTVMNLAWLTVLDVMGLLIVMKKFGADFDHTGVRATASILALVVMLVAAALEYFYREVFYGAVIAWAFIGIIIHCNYMELVYIVCLIVSCAMVIVSVIRKVYGLERPQDSEGSSMGQRLVRAFTFGKQPRRTREEDDVRAPLAACADV
eukprot:evm.model.scf_701EXC.3 EVM.evm.TU.scf_701EXC.3   scf_701EXC:62979-67369(+)